MDILITNLINKHSRLFNRAFMAQLNKKIWFCLAGLLLATSQGQANSIEQLTLPEGYKITVAAKLKNPRQIAVASPYHIFVGSRNAGTVSALIDSDKDGHFDKRFTLARNLNMPTGIAFYNNDLYITAVSTIYRIKKATQVHHGKQNPKLELVYNQLPRDRHHGWKYLRIRKEGDEGAGVYLNVGAPCNICLSDDPRYASLMRLDLHSDGSLSNPEIIAHGVRNSVGFDFDPQTGDVWFTDNGRDHLGDDLPDDELNHLETFGQHFGYPFIHGNQVVEPDRSIISQAPNRGFSWPIDANQFTSPVHGFGAHRAPLGMHFYTDDTFPDADKHPIFVALHGSWNRSSKVGYTVVKLLKSPNSDKMDASVFVEGWLEGENAWGRPSDISGDGLGGLLIADDFAGVIYRVSYAP